jgi:hypothetical protein
MVPTISSGGSDYTHPQTSTSLFDFLAVRAFFWAWPSRECISVVVLLTLTVFRCKVMLLRTLDPTSCLPLQVLETQQPGQGRVISVQVKLLPIQIFVQYMISCNML